MRLDDLLQRHTAIDDGLQLTRFAQALEQQQVVQTELREIIVDRDGLATRIERLCNSKKRRRALPSAHRVDDDVVAVGSLREIFLRVVHDPFCTEGLDEREIPRTAYAGHLRPEV